MKTKLIASGFGCYASCAIPILVSAQYTFGVSSATTGVSDTPPPGQGR
jgi:hypothetical protein